MKSSGLSLFAPALVVMLLCFKWIEGGSIFLSISWWPLANMVFLFGVFSYALLPISFPLRCSDLRTRDPYLIVIVRSTLCLLTAFSGIYLGWVGGSNLLIDFVLGLLTYMVLQGSTKYVVCEGCRIRQGQKIYFPGEAVTLKPWLSYDFDVTIRPESAVV